MLSTLCKLPTQEDLDRALSAMSVYNRANALYPSRAAAPETPFVAPTLDELKEIYRKCMQPEQIAVLVF